MKVVRIMIIASMTTMFVACGQTTSDRALSGGAIGAGVGAVGAGVTGGSPVTGAVVGGALGAATGAITKERDVNLGKPAWRR